MPEISMSEIFIAKLFIKLSRGLYLIKINIVFYKYCYGINNIEQQYFSCWNMKICLNIIYHKDLLAFYSKKIKKAADIALKFVLIKVILLVFLMSLNICTFCSFWINGVPQYTWFVLILFTPFRPLFASYPLNASNILPLCGQVVCHMSLI